MRFFKYLIFIFLSLFSISVFSAFEYSVDGVKWYPNADSACVSAHGASGWWGVTIASSSFITCVGDNGHTLSGISSRVVDCPSSVSSDPISVPNWDKWTLEQSDAYYSKNVVGKTACYQGCRYKDPSMGGDAPELHLTYGSPVKDSSCPPDGTTKPSTPFPDGTPPQPTECKNSSGSDSYCDKPPTGCPSGYTSGSFNNKQICVKNSPDPDPTKPNPNDPNNGDGKGSCNGTNNCNTTNTNFDDSGIISAINSLKSSFTSAISSMTNTLSSAISSVTSAVNSVSTAVNSNTAAVNTNGDKVKNSVDANTAAVNTNGDKVKNSVDANTAAVNANGDKVKNSVDANTAAVNTNGDKVKNSVDANTAAVNANGDKVKNSVDANTAAVKEGNGLLGDIKNWLTSTDGVSADSGLLGIDPIQIEPQQDKFQWSAQCPSPIEKNTTIIGYSWTYSFTFDSWCSVLAKLSNYFLFAAWFGACLIIAGVRNG